MEKPDPLKIAWGIAKVPKTERRVSARLQTSAETEAAEPPEKETTTAPEVKEA